MIALTTPNKNRLREIADLALDTIADETQHRSSAIASRTAQNVLTDLIFSPSLSSVKRPRGS